jgi:hyperosmotically inducible protein
MLKKLSVVILGAAFTLMTAGYATAQTAAQEVKEKTKAAGTKSVEVVTDAEITTAVKTKLLADKTVGGLKIDVDTTNGVVTLTGPVHSGVERAEALKLARNTKGVKSVKNKLVLEAAATTGRTDKDDKIKAETKEKAGQVKEKAIDAKEAVTDASITAAVKTKLLADTKVGGLKIDVDTKDNVVTLTGPVHSAAEKAEAVRLAKTTTGVKSVIDKLTIQPK